jgi:hypothetical protein
MDWESAFRSLCSIRMADKRCPFILLQEPLLCCKNGARQGRLKPTGTLQIEVE